MAPRAPRSDAAANRKLLVRAARQVLSESNGEPDELSLHRVARTAGVGQGTLYRHFATREHLLAEVYAREIGELSDAVPVLLAEHRPLAALERWLERVLAYARVKRGVMVALEAEAWEGLYADQHGRLDSALDALLEQGKRSGEVLAVAQTADVLLLLGSLTRLPAAEWDARAPVLVTLIVNGLRRR